MEIYLYLHQMMQCDTVVFVKLNNVVLVNDPFETIETTYEFTEIT